MAATTIKDGYNGGSDNQLKVNPDGSINVDTSGGGTGNVNIHDSAGNNLTSTGGALNVNVVSGVGPGTPIAVYNEITGVAMGATQTILTYTVPAATTLALTRVDVSGDSIGMIEVEFNNVVNAKRRLYYTEFNIRFEYLNQQDGLNLPTGTVITIVATNNSVQGAGTFNATLQGVTST